MFNELQRAGVSAESFTDDYEKAWRFVSRSHKNHGRIPSPDVLQARFPDIEIHKVKDRDVPILLHEIQMRKKFRDFMEALDEASRYADGPEDIDEAISTLQEELISLSSRSGKSAIIDLLAGEGRKRMEKDLKRRRRGEQIGIPTGLKRFDYYTGGLVRRKMVVIMARTGIGKSWLNLLFVVSAVLNGYKVVLYPLEMTLEETALRLYTIFSHKIFGPGKEIKNLDLTMGRYTPKKITKLFDILENKYKGQLYVADIGSLSDPYTVERIESEVSLYQPDLFWVDYLTLMKGPVGKGGSEDYTTIKYLSRGIKGIAQRQNTVGGCSAQVSREALRVRAFLPRVEHLAYGDSIGHDADQVIALNRKDNYLFYGLVKHRGGPEIGKTRVLFGVDRGVIEETKDQEDDDE